MKRLKLQIILFCFSICISSHATYKVYLIHGYGGTGLEMRKIQKSLIRNGYNIENFRYNSFKEDIDSVGHQLFIKIKTDGTDTISFVTHSMGGIVVRSLYKNLYGDVEFPFIHRIVMIAPPNKGSPVADYFKQFEFIRFIAGPNIHNLTTDPITGANKYPVPKCEVGLIIGNINRKQCFTVPLNEENDGVVLTKSTKMGIEKDIRYVRASHILLLFNKQVKKYVTSFLNTGSFK